MFGNQQCQTETLDGETFLNIESDTSDIMLDLFNKKSHLLIKLKQVNISCGMKEIPNAIFDLKYLTELNLSNNSLEILPAELGNLCNLITLKLSGNKLHSLPKSIKSFQQLKHLDLCYNRFSEIPEVLYYSVRVLQVLDLSGNQITKFNEPPACLTKLIVLGISNNLLKELPHWIYDNLCQLQFLNISGNSLSLDMDCVNYCFTGAFQSLQILNFENCNLSYECIQLLSHFKNLNTLSLGNKKCSNENKGKKNYMGNLKIDIFKNLGKMKCLIMQNAQIATLPLDFDCLKNIEMLEISGNLLSWLPECFCNLTSLKILRLTSNQLLFLPSDIGNLINLQQIHLANNKLYQIPKSFYNLVNLEFIDLYNNKIDEIDSNIFKFKNLKGVDLGMNCLEFDFFENDIDNKEMKELYGFLKDSFRKRFCYLDNRCDLQMPASQTGFYERSSDCQSNDTRYSSSSFESDSFSVVVEEDSPPNITEVSYCEDENWEREESIQSEEDEFFDPNEMNKRLKLSKYWSLDFRNNYCPAKYHALSLIKTYKRNFAITLKNETVEDGQFDSD